MLHDAFVYCWTDHKTNKLYIGSHKGSIDDGYICSSKLMIEEYKKRPNDFTRQIVAEGTFTDIRKFESILLDTLDVKNNPSFYNMHNGNGNFYLKGHTEEYKKRQSKLLKGKKKKKSSRKKILSNEHKQAISASRKGKKLKPFSKTHKLNMSISRKKYLENNKNPQIGRTLSDITKLKISDSHSDEWIITDPNGKNIIIKNLWKYCKDNKLTYSSMFKVSTGERKHHKNYKVAKRLKEIH